MQIEITTQYMENYGFCEGEQYWKAKGGDVYSIPVELAGMLAANSIGEYLQGIVNTFEQTLTNDDCSAEYVTGWELQD